MDLLKPFRLLAIRNKMIKKTKIINKLKRLDYEIPSWCRMSLESHADGIGGCWGISYGYVREKGEAYCKKCEYYEVA